MGITTDLARDLYEIRLTDKDREQLRTLIIDFFAASFAGKKLNRAFNEAVEAAVYPQGGAGEASVFLREGKYPARMAAFMNAVYGHGAELDDGNKAAAGHPGVHLLPAVFALAEKLGSTDEDVFLALATGYEAYIRISSAAVPGLIKRSFHSTGMAGTLADAAACARLYHLDAQGIEESVALATTMSGGLLSYGDSRPAIKPLNPAKAAENGLFAAQLAANGMRGPEEALEGPNGWFHAVTDEVHEEYLRGSDHLLIHDCYFKLYPSCRHTHCGIDAAVSLHGKIGGREIKKVRVFIYPNAIKLAGIRIPREADETKFSICYTLATALLQGNYGAADMDPVHLTPEILELIDRIELIPDESMEDRVKKIRGTRVEVLLADGETLEETVLVPKGDPERPLSRADIVEKLHVLAAGQASKEKLTALVERIEALGGEKCFRYPGEVLLGGET